MSADRAASNTHRPLKPSLASTRTARTLITPRVGTNATPSTKSTTSRPTPPVRSAPSTPRAKQTGTSTPLNDPLVNGNVTPRSSTRTSRVSASASPALGDDTPSAARPKSSFVTSHPSAERNGSVGGLGISAGLQQNKARASKAQSLVSDNGSGLKAQSPLSRSPGFSDLSRQPTDESIDSRFFHASDAPTSKPEPPPRKPEPKKAQFFHADGRQELDNVLPGAASPVLSAVSEQRSSGPWIRSDSASNPSKSPPVLSPALSTFSGNSPFFTPAAVQSSQKRSPSPSKENIHLSYRKGASQIFGTRPPPRKVPSNTDIRASATTNERHGSIDASLSGPTLHHKSPSLSSIDSVSSQPSRRRSGTTAEVEPTPSPLAYEFKAATVPRISNPTNNLPSIDTSLESPGPLTRTESGLLSPSKSASELAAEARRERKVLDLEISNSSLLAINATLEREVRRQKTELKRFRRLSRAGRFSLAPGERAGNWAEALSSVGEEDEGDDDVFGLPSGEMGMQDEFSDDDDDEESLISSSEPLSPSAQSRRESDRLAKDEKRLQVDLQKHKELLVQSQAMNQSLKRCMYATEDMIREGKKALDYRVRVSDVKLGGRVLSSHDHDHEDGDVSQEIEVEDETLHNDTMDQAKGFLDTWAGIGQQNFEGSEGGDRDSGIEADRPPPPVPPQLARKFSTADEISKLRDDG